MCGIEMRDVSICTPDIYYNSEMQDFIRRRCKDEDKQWIYRMIDSVQVQESNEVVYIRTPEWVLCKDIHQGTDFRMLVIFCDRKLQTLRDLRAEHTGLLLDVERQVRAWLHTVMKPKQVDKYQIYFHYMPSVYQPHAHVCVPGTFYNSMRSHKLAHVVRNLTRNSFWYHNALIMFSLNKTIRQLQVYRVLNADTFTEVPNAMQNGAGALDSCKAAGKSGSKIFVSKGMYRLPNRSDKSEREPQVAAVDLKDASTNNKVCRETEQ